METSDFHGVLYIGYTHVAQQRMSKLFDLGLENCAFQIFIRTDKSNLLFHYAVYTNCARKINRNKYCAYIERDCSTESLVLLKIIYKHMKYNQMLYHINNLLQYQKYLHLYILLQIKD